MISPNIFKDSSKEDIAFSTRNEDVENSVEYRILQPSPSYVLTNIASELLLPEKWI